MNNIYNEISDEQIEIAAYNYNSLENENIPITLKEHAAFIAGIDWFKKELLLLNK